jgi:tetratricopeptide (TPR) repeat protein
MPRRRLALALLVAAPLAGTPPTAAAQSPAERAAIAAFRDSLAGAASVAAVDSIVGRRDGPAARHHLRAGFGALREAELAGGRGPLDAAVLAFEEAIRRERDWPYAWFGLGLAKLELHRGGYVAKASTFHVVGLSNYAAFTQSMERTLARDSLFPPLLRLLSELLPAQGDREQPDAYLRALERALTWDAGDPRPALVLARAARTAGRHGSALALVERYAALGGDAGVAALERARLLHALGRPEAAARSYLGGLRRLSPDARTLYRRDLAWIATEAELAAFDGLAPDSVPDWVGRFWSRRDAESLHEPGARLVEHLRRWNHVHGHFRVVDPERRTMYERVRMSIAGACALPARTLDQLDYVDNSRIRDDRWRERLVDHRAVVYMRHGEPARRIGTTTDRDRAALLALGDPAEPIDPNGGQADEDDAEGAQDAIRSSPSARTGGSALAEVALEPLEPMMGIDDQPPSESWLYWFAGEPRIFHFRGSGALGQGPTTLDAQLPGDEEILRSLAVLDRRYAKLANIVAIGSRPYGMAMGCHPVTKEIERDNYGDLRAVVTTDSWTPIHPGPLEPIVQTFAVGRPDRGTGRLLVVYAARGDRLRPDPTRAPDGRLTYTLLVRATAIDSATGAVRRLDTTRTVAVADTLRDGQHLTGVVELSLPAGRWSVRALVEQPGGAGSAFELPAPARLAARTLALSDLVLGREGSGLAWAGPDGPVPLNPLNAFPLGGAVELYYELYGLVPGREYRTTVEVRKASAKDARGGVRLAFSDAAVDESARVRRTIGLKQLKRGRYRLVVTVQESGGGPAVVRERMINVLDR